MIISITILILAIAFLTYKIGCYIDEINRINVENNILKTENYSLKRVMRENDLIPEEYVK